MKGPAGPFINNPQGPKRPENSPVDCFQRRAGGSPGRETAHHMCLPLWGRGTAKRWMRLQYLTRKPDVGSEDLIRHPRWGGIGTVYPICRAAAGRGPRLQCAFPSGGPKTPENVPVAHFQWRPGGSPGRGTASAVDEVSQLSTLCLCSSANKPLANPCGFGYNMARSRRLVAAENTL